MHGCSSENEWEQSQEHTCSSTSRLAWNPAPPSFSGLFKTATGHIHGYFPALCSPGHLYQTTVKHSQTQLFCFHTIVLYWLLQAWLPNVHTEQWRITQMYLRTVFFQHRISFCAPRTVPLQLVGQRGDGMSGFEGTPGPSDILHGSFESGCNISKTVTSIQWQKYTAIFPNVVH